MVDFAMGPRSVVFLSMRESDRDDEVSSAARRFEPHTKCAGSRHICTGQTLHVFMGNMEEVTNGIAFQVYVDGLSRFLLHLQETRDLRAMRRRGLLGYLHVA